MSVRARNFTYDLHRPGLGGDERRRRGALPSEEAAWTPEHLVLAALGRCTLTSFLTTPAARVTSRSATRRRTASSPGVRRTDASRSSRCGSTSTSRSTAPPSPDEIRELIAKGERDCFVGASLTVKPDYHWTVNGEDLS